jgi:predicted tellurium resistance membrane protein TerC
MLTGTESGSGVGLLLTLGYAIYWIARSKKKWHTVGYALLAIVITIGIGLVLAFVFPWAAAALGTAIGLVSFMAMALAASHHGRSTLKPTREGLVAK